MSNAHFSIRLKQIMDLAVERRILENILNIDGVLVSRLATQSSAGE